MTEAEWLGGTDPEKLLRYAAAAGRGRKLRLFACACVRQMWHLLGDEHSRRAVTTSERYADGLASEEALAAARQELMGWLDSCYLNWRHGSYTDEHTAIMKAALASCHSSDFRAGRDAARHVIEAAVKAVVPRIVSRTAFAQVRPAREEQQKACCRHLRDLLGDPFRPIRVVPSWLTWNDGTVRKVAQAIYEGSAFDRLPILADALEDAGCAEAELLGHLRGPGPHVRGCWALDLLLDRG
jgi:hypothetical protein